MQEYLAQHLARSPVRLLKTKRREGLIRARMFGAAAAVGQVSMRRLPTPVLHRGFLVQETVRFLNSKNYFFLILALDFKNIYFTLG